MEKQDLLVNYRYIVISFGNTQVHSRDLTIGRTNTFLIETLVFFLSLETLGEEFPFCDSKTIRLTVVNLGFAMPRLSVR